MTVWRKISYTSRCNPSVPAKRFVIDLRWNTTELVNLQAVWMSDSAIGNVGCPTLNGRTRRLISAKPQYLPSKQGPVAQSAEQGTFNPKVEGSIPSGPTNQNLRK